MSGKNCSTQGFHVLWKSKYKDISIIKVPSGDSKFETNWRNILVAVVTRDRIVDDTLRKGIENKRIFICQQHFRTDQNHAHDKCKTLIPGEIPELNIPVRSIPSTKPKRRPSPKSISIKKQMNG